MLRGAKHEPALKEPDSTESTISDRHASRAIDTPSPYSEGGAARASASAAATAPASRSKKTVTWLGDEKSIRQTLFATIATTKEIPHKDDIPPIENEPVLHGATHSKNPADVFLLDVLQVAYLAGALLDISYNTENKTIYLSLMTTEIVGEQLTEVQERYNADASLGPQRNSYPITYTYRVSQISAGNFIQSYIFATKHPKICNSLLDYRGQISQTTPNSSTTEIAETSIESSLLTEDKGETINFLISTKQLDRLLHQPKSIQPTEINIRTALLDKIYAIFYQYEQVQDTPPAEYTGHVQPKLSTRQEMLNALIAICDPTQKDRNLLTQPEEALNILALLFERGQYRLRTNPQEFVNYQSFFADTHKCCCFLMLSGDIQEVFSKHTVFCHQRENIQELIESIEIYSIILLLTRTHEALGITPGLQGDSSAQSTDIDELSKLLPPSARLSTSLTELNKTYGKFVVLLNNIAEKSSHIERGAHETYRLTEPQTETTVFLDNFLAMINKNIVLRNLFDRSREARLCLKNITRHVKAYANGAAATDGSPSPTP